ncbi:MAG: hypothetical protein WAU07_01155 [Microgenomates group bacterium]
MENFSNVLALRVLLTLGYSQVFSYPLTAQEIWLRLVVKHTGVKEGDSGNWAKNSSLIEVKKALLQLVSAQKIICKNGYYFFSNNEKGVISRQERYRYSKLKWNEVSSFIEQVRHIPWIQGIAVTGSLAVNNVAEGEDIDFMIVTDPHRLWLTRVWVSGLAQIQGKRRSWKREDQNSWCFNLWLSSDQLKMPTSLHTVYGAYEVCQAEWVYMRPKSGVGVSFLKENHWARWYVPHLYAKKLVDVGRFIENQLFKQKLSLRQKVEFEHVLRLIDPVLFVFNYIFYGVQFLYMRRHMTREKVSLHSAFFHPRNTKFGIYEMWKLQLSSLSKGAGQ